MKHTVTFLVDCTITVEFEAPDDATKAQLEELAADEIGIPGLCHQCSDEFDMGDIIQVLTIDGEEVRGE